jgi:DNA-binding winged helix-turn-helix (wHTH) protein
VTAGTFHFEGFALDEPNRQLLGADGPVELNGRYFDALALMVREQGRLVSKDRFLDEIWRGIPVTDEALTQCIKTLRRQLGDDASNPRFIETVPKHGYRFIAPVAGGEIEPARRAPERTASLREFLLLGAAGTVGGAVAGVLGGLFYGFAGAAQGMGAISVLLVLVAITSVVAFLGGLGVSFGIAAARFAPYRPWQWCIIGGAFGGLLVGAVVKLLGLDAFNLLFGQSPGDITGPAEGGLLGAAIGLAAWLAMWRRRRLSLRWSVALGALAGGAAGLLIALLGRPMMGGSLALLAESFPNSRLRIDQVGRIFGESDFGPVTHAVTGALEGALFSACLVGAMVLAAKRLLKRA